MVGDRLLIGSTIVLQLASTKTVEQVLALTLIEPLSADALIFTLSFMRLQIFAVNSKSNLNTSCASPFYGCPYNLHVHVDGVHHTTKIAY